MRCQRKCDSGEKESMKWSVATKLQKIPNNMIRHAISARFHYNANLPKVNGMKHRASVGNCCSKKTFGADD